MELEETDQKVPRRRMGRPFALLRLIFVVFALGFFIFCLWRGGILALLAWLVTVIVLVDTSVNVLFAMYDEPGSRRLGFLYWLFSILMGAQGAQIVTPGGEIKAVRPAGPLANIFSRLGGPGMVVVNGGAAVVFERSGKFTRVKGPGLVWTKRFERVAKVIDLRRQVRGKEKGIENVQTRDGLSFNLDRPEVIFEPAAHFDAQRGEYAYSEEALLDLVFRGGFTYRDGKAQEWGDQVFRIVEKHLRDVAASSRLLDLVKSDDAGVNPRAQFVQQVEDHARPELQQFGIQLVGLYLREISVPAEMRDVLVMPLRQEAMLGISEGLQKAIDQINTAMKRDLGEARPHLLVNLTETLGHLLQQTLRLAGTDRQAGGRALLGSGEQTAVEK